MSQSSLPRSELQELRLEIEGIEREFDLAAFPRVLGFWRRWCALHLSFFRKMNKIPGETKDQERYFSEEVKKLLRIREAVLSSAMQFFRGAGAKISQEEKLLAVLIKSSDNIWTAVLDRESRRLREVYVKSRRRQVVIGAYSENG